MKKIAKKFICSIMCLSLSVMSCFAWTEKKYFWGSEYYVQANEIKIFKLHLKSIFNPIKTVNGVAAGIGGAVMLTGPVGLGVGIGTAVGAGAQQIAMDGLINELERRSYMGRAIFVSLPGIIQGWRVDYL